MNQLILSQGTKIRPLWGTAQLFMHPRYMHGGATRYISFQDSTFEINYNFTWICIHLVHHCSPEIGVYAYAAAQVKKAIEVGT